MDLFETPLLEPAVPVRPALGRPLVALMPFLADPPEPELCAMAAGISDLLHELLWRDRGMQGILVRSEYLEKAPPHAVDLVCRDLGVGHLIQGKCHAAGDAPSVYVELSETRDWHVRWAHFYRGGGPRLLEREGETMATLADILRRALSPKRRA